MDIKNNYKKKVVVIAHLFYSDLLREAFSYLQNIPHFIDLIITTPGENISSVKSLLISIDRTDAIVIPSGPRGRDVAALLVTAHKYLMKYEILCFIHDKKTTGSIGDPIIGDIYRKMIWQNLLGSSQMILDILKLIDEDENIGVIAPPAPYHGEYFLCLGDPWATAIEATNNVLERVNVSRHITRTDVPKALSTAFWCQVKSLKKLFEYPFSYNDFPDEPLPLNGALNHGVERAISFVAEDAGFDTVVLAFEKEQKRIYNDYERMLSQLCRSLSQKYYFNTFEGLVDEIENNKLLKFCQNHDILYIYGAGYHGIRLLPILDNMGFNAKGFIISDEFSFPDGVPLPVYHLSDISPAINMGCVVAAAQPYRIKMRKNLKNKNWDEENIYFLQ